METPKRLFLSSVSELTDSQFNLEAGMVHVCKHFSVGYRLAPYNVLAGQVQADTPYRLDDYRFILIHKGDFEVQANLQPMHMKEGGIGFMRNGGIVQFPSRMPDDVEVSAMMLQYDFLRYVMSGRVDKALDTSVRNFAVEADPAQFALAEQILATIYSITATPDYNEKVVESLIAAFVHLFISMREQDAQAHSAPVNRADAVFNDFIALVNEHCAAHHTLDFYADKLCLTQRYLGSLVRQSSGVTAKEWIDRAIIAQAKVALRYSDVTIAMLADQLGFPNAAFFTKYFKRLTGQTPSAFRHG